jgi:transposase
LEDDGFEYAGASSSLFIHATEPKGRHRERERWVTRVPSPQCESISQFGIYIPGSRMAATGCQRRNAAAAAAAGDSPHVFRSSRGNGTTETEIESGRRDARGTTPIL